MSNYRTKEGTSSIKSNVVVFTGGEFPAPEKTAEFWNSPLVFGKAKAPDFVIAADSGIEALRVYCNYFNCTVQSEKPCVLQNIDFSPDLILGDFDSISDKAILDEYPQEIIEKSPAYKDLTDTELALKAARKCFGHSCFITLVGGAGGRADHFLGIYDLFGTDLAPDAWLCGEQVLLNAKRKTFLVQGLQIGAPVSIAQASMPSLLPVSWCIKTRGLEWESGVFRKRGMPSISNTVSKEFYGKAVEFNFRHGNFVLILPLNVKISLN